MENGKKRQLVACAAVISIFAAAGLWYAQPAAHSTNSADSSGADRQNHSQAPAALPDTVSGALTNVLLPGGTASTGGTQHPGRDHLLPPLPFAGQVSTDKPRSRRETQEAIAEWEKQGEAIAVSAASKYGWATEGESNGRTFKLMAIRNGRVYRYATCNINAAISSAAHAVRQTAPYNVDGDGVTVGLWDAGSARPTHQEFDGRISLKNSSAVHYHSTHVAGTIAASGIDANARGMAPMARVDSYNWDYDSSEMAAAGMSTDGETGVIQISNHSYGLQTGWEGTEWFGGWGDHTEADGFGLYDVYAATWDNVCYGAPYYLPFKSAGNDRSDSAPGTGVMFSYHDGTQWQTKPYDPLTDPPRDGWDNGGYDTVTLIGNAKNIMTVGAANDAAAAGVRNPALATMTSFSAWGPSDDGRIKPDIVANGSGLWSTYSSHDSSYAALSGTSMSAPNAAGSAALLVDLYSRLFPGKAMLASTLKGLIIHAADDIGRPGPDYINGWGLMNTEAAAAIIRAHHGQSNAGRIAIGEIMTPGDAPIHEFVWDGTSPIKVTICWTDYPGTPRDTLDDRAPVLVNDLDLRIIDPTGATNFPYVLSVTNPAAPALNGDNDVDNVEQVYISNPPTAGTYRAVIHLEGALTGSSQPYSFIVSGATYPPRIEHAPLVNTTNSVTPYVVECTINSDGLTNGVATLFYRVGDDTNQPFLSSTLNVVSNSLYAGVIPAQPVGSHIRYYIEATTVNGLSATAPPEGASAPFSFFISPPVSLHITWSPAEVGVTQPPYGTTLYASGSLVQVSAAAYTESLGGFRYDCHGWTGTGSVPPSGDTNSLAFTLEQNSTLTWIWQPTFRLLQESSLPNLLSATNWWPVGQTAETVAAQPLFGGSFPIHFAGWYVDGARMPDATSAADNPATNIVMNIPRRAEALYMLDVVNDDGDSLPDWWEFFYFGSAAAVQNADSDDDGFTNAKEFQDGTNPRDPASIPSAPSIAHMPFTSTRTSPAPWHVSAIVTDNHVVGNVSVVWTRNGGPQQSLPMTYNATLGHYETAFGEPGVTGDTFSYRIEARDAASLLSSSGPFGFDVAYPVSVITPDGFGTLYLPAMTSTDLLVVVSNAGHRTLDWSATVEFGGLSNDVESGSLDWSHSGANDAWHISTNLAYSGSQSWFFGSATGGNYPDNATAALVTPQILLSSPPRPTYMQWLDTEPPKDAVYAWDGCFVELSTNNGASFFQIAPVGGYSHIVFGHSESPYPEGTPCFTGSGGWQKIEFDLSAYELQSVRIAFRFGSDGYVTAKGWYLDDIVITPYGGSHEWISIAPTQGVVAVADTDQIGVHLSTEHIPPGTTLAGGVRVSSNDPREPHKVVPVFLHNASRVVTVTQPENGSIEPAGQIFLLRGDSTNFIVSADPYFAVAAVVADGITNILTTSAPVAVTNIVWKNVTENGTLTALMKASTATNGVPVWWLASYGLTNGDFDTAVMLDQDGDTMATWAEYIAGTDPTETTSVLSIADATPLEEELGSTVVTNDGFVWTNRHCVVTGVVLRWPSVSNRIYSVQSDSTSPGATVVGDAGIPATPPHNTTTQSVDALPLQFYRIGVSLP